MGRALAVLVCAALGEWASAAESDSVVRAGRLLDVAGGTWVENVVIRIEAGTIVSV